ncbi:hypothetical protein, partial [Curtobacterium sp. ME12]|uniref:hypothetical protein n=1 Tax=Curtobacterium sp. ME12 TaxID=2744253 RepID=UPI001C70C50C
VDDLREAGSGLAAVGGFEERARELSRLVRASFLTREPDCSFVGWSQRVARVAPSGHELSAADVLTDSR